jgi:glucosamine--fructose-6-phosphate aminotransferase (isomerizing)
MCGIVAVLRRPSERTAPQSTTIIETLDEADLRLREAVDRLARGPEGVDDLVEVAALLELTDLSLRGTAGLACLLTGSGLPVVEAVHQRAEAIGTTISQLEARLDAPGHPDAAPSPGQLEQINAAVVRLKDSAWALGKDRLDMARAVADLVAPADLGASVTPAALDAFWAIQVALASLDRLEVRGRDSAGLHVLLADHQLDLSAPDVRALLGARAADPLFTSLAVCTPGGRLSLVYKAAAEIGELGDNTRALRTAIRNDPLLHRALSSSLVRCTVLAHTRWASVGVISQPNAHPLNSEEPGRPTAPYLTAALNGDVDNHADLRVGEGLTIPPEVTTDAKVIPTMISRRVIEGFPLDEAFRRTANQLEGSVAFVASPAQDPDRLLLALRGSGQSLYVGLAEDAYVVASEPYGLVEETSYYFRLDGETADESGHHGQIVMLDRSGAGTTDGVRRESYDGMPLPVGAGEVRTAQVTTRDIDRSGFSHFLLKEISEAPQSFRKTLRGRVVTDQRSNRLVVQLGQETLPARVRDRLSSGHIKRICVIGQGTAAVAGQSVAAALSTCLTARSIPVTAMLATELSGFALADDMADTLVVAVSQSGTTTDTNRTVDLVRSRGASVISIVNRRNSDLVEKSDGVLYTSDGRDIEMSVASTKAFYAQVAAGFLLALGLADVLGCSDRRRTEQLLSGLRALPDAMEEVLSRRDRIALAATQLAPPRRHWAVVGNGANRIAAAEIRIKLSELCYKSIACDGTEDKKHIDLSSEPLVVVCAAGLGGANADDVAKEVAIYRAHKAAPVVIASAEEASRYPAAAHVIDVPNVDPDLAFVLTAMAGHLFAYEAALSIDAQARPLREARAAIEAGISGAAVSASGTGSSIEDEIWLSSLRPALASATMPFFEGLRAGAYNGHLEAGTAVRVASLLRYATGVLPVEGYELEYGKIGTPSAILADLIDALTAAIDELTRPVDAIKHQAKTVTVGISRSEEALLKGALVREVLGAGASQDCLSYRALRTLAELDPAVVEVTGFTRYRIDGDVAGSDEASIHVVDRGGVSLQIPSRTDRRPVLRGTKHRAAEEREVTVARGRSDGRTVILVPETKDNQVTGMTLLHVKFHDRLPWAVVRQILSGYRNRYAALTDAVTETEPSFDDTRLAEVSLVDLLTEPVYVLADRWRRP